MMVVFMLSYNAFGQITNIRTGKFSCWEDGVLVDEHNEQHKAEQHAANLALQSPGKEILIKYPESIRVKYEYMEGHPPTDSIPPVIPPVIPPDPEPEPEPVAALVLVTTSKHTAWKPSNVVSGDSLFWVVTAQNMDTIRAEGLMPTFDLSGAFGDVTMNITSSDDFETLTVFSITAQYTKSADFRNAVKLQDFALKMSDELTYIDVSTMVEAFRFTLRSNSLTSLDISKNTKLTHLYAYNNHLTSSAIDSIFIHLDSFGLENGVLNIDGNPGRLSAIAHNHYQNLMAKGWDISVDLQVVPPDAPVLDEPTNVTKTSADLSWYPALTGPRAAKFMINQNGVDIGAVDSQSPIGQQGAHIAGLAEATTYNYHIIAMDSLDNRGPISNIVSFKTDSTHAVYDTIVVKGAAYMLNLCTSYKPRIVVSLVEDGTGDTLHIVSEKDHYYTRQRLFKIKREIWGDTIKEMTNLNPPPFHVTQSWDSATVDTLQMMEGHTTDYSNGWVLYGKDSTNLNIWSEKEFSYTWKDHTILTPGTGIGQKYYFRFYAQDSLGFMGAGDLNIDYTSSEDVSTFRVIESFIQEGDLYVTDTTAKTRTWANANNEIKLWIGRAPYSLFEYETATGFNASNPEPGVWQHGRWFEGLTPNTDYWYKVQVTDELGNSAVSGRIHFKTKE